MKRLLQLSRYVWFIPCFLVPSAILPITSNGQVLVWGVTSRNKSSDPDWEINAPVYSIGFPANGEGYSETWVRGVAESPALTSTVFKTGLLIPASVPIRLSINPPEAGVISGATNGQSLQVMKRYTLTATPRQGFAFKSWTGSVASSTPSLTFTMATNTMLTASFVDVQKPTVTIVVPAAGSLSTTNAGFIVKGRAADNGKILEVRYQLNNQAWKTADGTSNWQADLQLAPGPNTIKVYSLDSFGNQSITNSVNLNYILRAKLKVAIVGSGTVTPNLNDGNLEVGKTYSMTAVAAGGFGFVGWTGSITTNKPVLTFVMTTDASFTAAFIDVLSPTVSITSPAINQRLTTNSVMITGSASDNVKVATVQYQLGNGEWQTADGTTKWQGLLRLTPGTNTVRARSTDLTGNISLADSKSFVYVQNAPLTLRTNGNGTINPNYAGQLLELGKSYTITAKPTKGYGFTSWSGGVTSTMPNLTFVMVSNLTVIANFTDKEPPTIAITSPKQNAIWSNSVFTVAGTASDNDRVASVWYQLNAAPWTNAVGSNNWAAAVALTLGTNTVRAYAQDVTGNRSTTNTAKVVSVVPPPTITRQPANVVVEVGTFATFSVTASGPSPLTYQWRRGVINIAGATNSTLVIDPVKHSDGGSYSVLVSHSSAAVSSDVVTLTVLPSNKVFTGPYRFDVLAGGRDPNVRWIAPDGIGTDALFGTPIGIVADKSDNLYITDSALYSTHSLVRKLTTTNATVKTLAILETSSSQEDLQGVAIGRSGIVYVADKRRHTIYWVSATDSGIVAGFERTRGSQDGKGTNALFSAPKGVTADNNGNLYVTDTDNQTIRKIDDSGVVTTLAGKPKTTGASDGQASSARFFNPYGIVFAPDGNLYVAEEVNSTIRKVTPNGVVTTFAGVPRVSGHVDGTGARALFKNPRGLAVDAGGNLFVADTGNSAIRKITKTGIVTTIGSLTDGTMKPAQLRCSWVAIDARGVLYIPDGSVILKGVIDPRLVGQFVNSGTPDQIHLREVPTKSSLQYDFGALVPSVQITGLSFLADGRLRLNLVTTRAIALSDSAHAQGIEIEMSNDLKVWRTVDGNYFQKNDGFAFELAMPLNGLGYYFRIKENR